MARLERQSLLDLLLAPYMVGRGIDPLASLIHRLDSLLRHAEGVQVLGVSEVCSSWSMSLFLFLFVAFWVSSCFLVRRLVFFYFVMFLLTSL